jgi:hypothetical protein
MRPSVTIKLKQIAGNLEWWVRINWTYVMRLDLSPDASPRVVRAVAEEALVKLVRSAIVQC